MTLVHQKTEQEKVISAIENCIATPKCRDCPWDECEEQHETVKLPLGLAKEALELLKTSEAHVMKFEEAARNALSFLNMPDSVKPVFVQFKDETYMDEGLTPPWRNGVNQRAILMNNPNRYGKDFVFWTDRPSPKQMMEVVWE